MKLGFIGLGDMGIPMVMRLLEGGYRVAVWNRTPEKLHALYSQHDRVLACSDPSDVMKNADLIGLCLTSDKAVADVTFGERGLFAAAGTEGKVIIDFSTGSAEAAQDFARYAQKHGASWIDAPVSGGVPAAAAGRLIVFAGGDAEALAKLEPMLSLLARRVAHMGDSGAGQTTKICNQMIVATNVLAIAETIALARSAGVQVERLAEALAGGFADSAPLQIFGPRMALHKFEPRLGAIALMRKDVGLAVSLAAKHSCDTPMLGRAAELYSQFSANEAECDLSRLIALYEDVES